MTERHRWIVPLMLLALAACDEPADTDAGVDATVEDDGGSSPDAGRDAGSEDPDSGASDPDAGPVQAPVVSGATPSSIARGASLVIDGTDLGGASAVTIGGTAQTIDANTDDSITIDAVAAETAIGDQELVVTTAGGSGTPISVTVLEALGVSGASAVSSTTVTVMFSRDLDATTVAAEDFTIDGLTVSDATTSGSDVTLTTDEQTAGTAYTVEVAGVTDTFGNALTGASSAPFTGFTPGAPTIVTISESQLVHAFSTLTITGTNLSGASVTIGGAAQPITSNTATEIVTGPVPVSTPLGTQPVMVTTAGGDSGSMNVEVLERFRLIPPATATSATEVTLTFNRDVDATTVNGSRFTISGLTISAATATADTVTLTTSEQIVDATYTVSASAAVLDTLGAPVTADTVSFSGFRPPPPTELIVVRVGDGTTTLSAAAEPVFLERRAISDGAVLGTLAMPTTTVGGNYAFTLGGSGFTANSDGALSRSEDGTMLAMAGYQVAPGTATPRSDSSPRVVAILDAADLGATPSVDTRTTLGTLYNTTSPRGAVIDGTTIWVVGGFGGVWTVPLGGSTPTRVDVAGSPSSGRAIAIFDGQLFYTSGGGTVPNQLNQVGTGLPTASDTPVTAVYAGTSPYSFTGFDLDPSEPGLDTFYQADSSAGLQRWEKAGGTWSVTATFTSSTPLFQATCFEDGADIVCVAASSTALYYLRDTGGTSPDGPMSMLASRAANTEFRGVAIPPVP